MKNPLRTHSVWYGVKIVTTKCVAQLLIELLAPGDSLPGAQHFWFWGTQLGRNLPIFVGLGLGSFGFESPGY